MGFDKLNQRPLIELVDIRGFGGLNQWMRFRQA